MSYRTFIQLMRDEHELVFRIVFQKRDEQFVILTSGTAGYRHFFAVCPSLHYLVVPVFGSDLHYSVESGIAGHFHIPAAETFKYVLCLLILHHHTFVDGPQRPAIRPAIPFEIWRILRSEKRHDISIHMMAFQLAEIIEPEFTYREDSLRRADYPDEFPGIEPGIKRKIEYPVHSFPVLAMTVP